MLEALKFVNGAVARKDFVPELMHFRIENGQVTAFNGMIGLCSPINLELDVTPRADQFMKSIQSCKDTIAIHVTPTGKLSIRSGKFKTLVECIAKENYPQILPAGDVIPLRAGFLNAIKTLAPFIADDAAKTWARGILFRKQSAFATNNVILVESWLGYKFPIEVNVPKQAVVELLRINEEPESMQVVENRITFNFSGGRWLTSQTYSTEWPDLARVINIEHKKGIPFPEGLAEAIETIAPFTDNFNKIYFTPGKVSTSKEDDQGASMEIESIEHEGVFAHNYLKMLFGVAKTIDFSGWPGPCIFYGDSIRGAIIGMRNG